MAVLIFENILASEEDLNKYESVLEKILDGLGMKYRQASEMNSHLS